MLSTLIGVVVVSVAWGVGGVLTAIIHSKSIGAKTPLAAKETMVYLNFWPLFFLVLLGRVCDDFVTARLKKARGE